MRRKLLAIVAELLIAARALHGRSLRVRRIVTAIPAAFVAVTIGLLALNLHNERSRWGNSVPILVADRKIARGEQIGATNSGLVRLPIALLPDTAVRSVPNESATRSIERGEIIVTSDVFNGEVSGVPSGWVVFSVGVVDSALGLQVGDSVIPYASGAPTCSIAQVAAVGKTRDESSQRVAIAVPAKCGGVLSVALAENGVTLGLSIND